MDFAYDIIDKLSEESDVDYAIVILRKGDKQDKLDFFYRFEKESKDTLKVLKDRLEDILKEDGDTKIEIKIKKTSKIYTFALKNLRKFNVGTFNHIKDKEYIEKISF